MKQKLIYALAIMLGLAILSGGSFYMGARHATAVANKKVDDALAEAAKQKELADANAAKAKEQEAIAQRQTKDVADAASKAAEAQKDAAASKASLAILRSKIQDLDTAPREQLVTLVKAQDARITVLETANAALQDKSDKDDKLVLTLNTENSYLKNALAEETKRADLNEQAAAWAKQALAHEQRANKLEKFGYSILSAALGYEGGKHLR